MKSSILAELCLKQFFVSQSVATTFLTREQQTHTFFELEDDFSDELLVLLDSVVDAFEEGFEEDDDEDVEDDGTPSDCCFFN